MALPDTLAPAGILTCGTDFGSRQKLDGFGKSVSGSLKGFKEAFIKYSKDSKENVTET